MRTSTISAIFDADIENVWHVTTNNQDVSWRSDLSHVEVFQDGLQFTEYTKQNQQTQFTVISKIPCQHYALQIENKLFNGYWHGDYEKTDDNKTKVTFTEEIQVKNPLIRLLAYLFWDLKKIQQTYINDLNKKLKES